MKDRNTTAFEKATNVLAYMDLQSTERSLTIGDATTGYALAQIHATLAVAEALDKLNETLKLGGKF